MYEVIKHGNRDGGQFYDLQDATDHALIVSLAIPAIPLYIVKTDKHGNFIKHDHIVMNGKVFVSNEH